MRFHAYLAGRSLLLAGALLLAATVPVAVRAAEPGAAALSIPVGTSAAITPPEGWTTVRQAGLVRFTPPEKDISVTVVAIAKAKDGQDAAAQAWRRADPSFAWPVRLAQPQPGRDGWDESITIDYDVPPATKAMGRAIAYRHGSTWTVLMAQGALATYAKRGAQIHASRESLRPAGYEKESFAGKVAHPMDAARIAQMKQFVQTAMAELKVPGVGLAIIDHGKIVYEGGLGVKDVATGAPVDKDTLFMVASNTKGMSTLLLATLVDDGKLDWDRPVIDYMPSFRLGSPETTRKVLVRHLVCACTGLPRKDMQMMFNTGAQTGPGDTFTQLAATEPTSGFGEVFQYNNLMASAAGYLGAHVLYPDMELGAAFDRAMRERIFDPLGMHETTLSNAQAMAGNWARPYDTGLDGRIALVDTRYNDIVVPYRPAGGAWSSAHDMALYVRNELDQGKLPDGRQMVSAKNLLARRMHNVPVGENAWYGMGLEEDTSSGVSVLLHGGSLLGYKSNWYAVPSAGVGVVVLTNGDASGYDLANGVRRRLLELLYDGRPEAAEDMVSSGRRADEALVKMRSELDLALTPDKARPFIGTYANADLGPLTVGFEGDRLMVRMTSMWSPVGTRKNKDGTTSLVTVAPGFEGMDFLVTTRKGKRAMVINDDQHEFAFIDKAP